MDYNSIGEFLEKFRKILFQKEEVKNIVVQTICENIHHQIEENSIRIKNGIIFIQGSPILRSEVLIHKKNILDKLKNLLPTNKFLDIK
jgi:hypothetical protein